jgi:type VI secretion system secreted protein VgrG
MVDPADVSALFGHVDEVRTSLRIEGQKDGSLTVLSFFGRDTLSGLSSYDLTVGSSAEVAAGLDDALGREVVFQVERADDDTSLHVMRGVVEEIFPSGVTVGKKQRETHLRIVPRLAELSHAQGCRVFQNLTVVEIAKQLFKLWHIEIDARLHPEPLKREYCTQVNETDFDFLSRIFAEEGIHFHLEHGKEKTVVVLVNDSRGYNPIAGKEKIPYRDAGGAITVDHIKSIRRERRVRPGSVAYRDYNFLKPQRETTSREETATPNAPGTLTAREFYEYPGHYNDPDEESVGVGEDVQRKTRSGAARAKLRLEEQRSQALTFSGTSTSLRMRVGQRFEIADHADKAFNGKFIIIGVQVGGATGDPARLDRGDRTSSAGIDIDFTAVPAETPIRPFVPPKPRAHLRTARVVGPKQDEPHVDEFGRIRIQFAWDREGQLDDKSSCWVRMATPVAHHNQGNYIAHRVGAEVLVDFLDGDVDRPIVVSALFNGDNRQPQKLPDDATRAVLYRGLSVPGNKGKNEISCEDRAGKEEILIHAQKDLNERVLHNHSETVGANQSYSIGANQSFSVGANQSISVGANRSVNVKGDENIHIVNSRHENVDDGESVTVKGGRSHTVSTKDDSLSVSAGNRSVAIALEHKLSAKSVVEVVETTVDINAGTSITIHHGGDSTFALKAGEASLGAATKIIISTPSGQITLAGGKVEVAAKDELILGSGGAKISMKKDGTLTLQGDVKVALVSGGSSVTLEPASAVVNGAAVNVTASGMMEISGAMVKIN